jgi:beta-lactamase regulating signal transducer with metallopeptidase domain
MLNDSLLHNLASLHWFWQSTLCIGIGLLGSFLLRQRPTHAHQILFWSMTAAIILPVLSALVKHYNLGLLQPEPTKTAAVSTPMPDPIPVAPVEWDLPSAMPEYQDDVPAIQWEPTYEHTSITAENYATELIKETYSAKLTDVTIAKFAPPIPTVPPREKNSIPWTFWAIGGWILITAILLSRLLLNFVKGFRLLHKPQSIDSQCIVQALQRAKSKLQIRQPVSVFQSRRIKTPLIWCWFAQPILLIPEPANPSGKKIDWVSVFCHELAHWKRRDHWCCLLAELLVCIFWPNPLVWWAKHRLIRLSEQACDDWVVAAGQSKTDYADSLLNLVPQGRITLVPTVIGGKKEMKNRIKRIIQDRADNPRISSRRTWLIGIMAIGLALGLALTQTRAAEREENEERERISREEGEERIAHSEERERAERDVHLRELDRELQKLKEAEQNTVRQLKGLRDGQDDEARELQAQLRRIREETSDIKRALYESTREKHGDQEREHTERAELRQDLAREMQELQERARDLEREMKELGDRNPGERREMQAELREIHQHMKNMEREMKGFDRERPELIEQDRNEWQMIQVRIQLERQELELRAREIRRALEEIGDDHPEKRRKLDMELDRLHEKMRLLERKTHELEQKRHAMTDRDLHERELHQKELMIHRKNLQQKLEHLERELKETDNDDKAHQFKREIEQTVAELHQVELQLQQDRPDRERPELSVMDRHLAELKKEIHRLAELGKHDQAEQLEQQARRLLQDQMRERPDAPRPPREPDMPRFESRPGLERQIHELRGQVGEMRQEMKEIRNLLRELLEQKRER